MGVIVNAFCCCCNLRKGCIVYAWLQMMYLVLSLATLIGSTEATKALVIGNRNNYLRPVFNSVHTSLSIWTAELMIKAVTCIVLTWGIIKKNYHLYQPWLFVQGAENAVTSLIALGLLITGFLNPLFFAIFLPVGVLSGVCWYLWICVYSVYKSDMEYISDYNSLNLGPIAEI